MPALIELQLEVLLARDSDGRLTVTRDPTPQPAPRVFLGRSAECNAWAVRADVSPRIRDELERLCAAEPLSAPSRERPPLCRERVCELLAPMSFEYRGPAYVLPEELPRDDRAQEARLEDSADWSETFPWLEAEFDSVAPVAIARVDDQAAAVCHSPRGSTSAAAEAGVETREPFRGRGLATAAVACWARAVQRSGRLALYSTSWDNAASQGVARRLSAQLYGEDWHVR
jgi:RimJ/RimL family protein N-acetyltransferase